MGKYHPHGDSAIYDTLVRMAQDFSLRYTLIDGQGNFGSVDGDNAAAMRYTECRLQKLAGEILADLDKETVDYGPNYDGKELEPLVMPSKIPNLLVNGSSGIAVGMATNIPPHNLCEVIDACLALIDNSTISVEELMDIVPAPDFPTKGIIYGTVGIKEAYRTGRGRVLMRAKTHIEDVDSAGGRQAIVIDELPYQVNKSSLLIRIGELVRDKRLEGISPSGIRDESDKSGMRVVLELKRGEIAEVVLNNLFKDTQLQDSFGMNMVALVDGQPKLLNLKDFIEQFVRHRKEVVTRRTAFELRKARQRAHILEGLAVALSNVDEIVALIKSMPTPPEAKAALMGRVWRSKLVEELLARGLGEDADLSGPFGLKDDGYHLSEAQAQRILEMQLQRLTGLEQQKIEQEYRDVIDTIVDLEDILRNTHRVKEIIKEELGQSKLDFGDDRRSVIEVNAQDISLEDLITPEDVVVTLSHTGYVKSQPLSDYQAQRRGGRGRQATKTKEDDFVDNLFVAHTHDYILCFSDLGRMYWLKVYEVPQASRASRGKPIVNLLQLAEGEKITAILPVKEFDDDRFVFMATSRGVVKKTPLSHFSRPRQMGIIAVDLVENDHLIGVSITNGANDIMLFSDGGKAVRFAEDHVRAMGRTARGVRGMRLPDADTLISLVVVDDEDQSVLTATENGYGKRTKVAEYTRHGRGTKGMVAIQTSERNGRVVSAKLVSEKDETMLITTGGVLIRSSVSEIREMGRATQGVRLINLGTDEKLAGLVKVEEQVDLVGPGDEEEPTG
jgi:DNA gyrase subunit A